jgi:hypothetical protein
MSKTDASLGPLVGTLTFDLPAKSTRTLSATQAYDTSRSQVVLGSFTGKLTDKSVVVKADFPGNSVPFDGGITINAYGGVSGGLDFTRGVYGSKIGMKTVTLNAWAPKADRVISGNVVITANMVSNGITFGGSAPASRAAVPLSSNPKATNANTTYYGSITVALGKYKKWQGNYAVLKINSVTETAILRIYAD